MLLAGQNWKLSRKDVWDDPGLHPFLPATEDLDFGQFKNRPLFKLTLRGNEASLDRHRSE